MSVQPAGKEQEIRRLQDAVMQNKKEIGLPRQRRRWRGSQSSLAAVRGAVRDGNDDAASRSRAGPCLPRSAGGAFQVGALPGQGSVSGGSGPVQGTFLTPVSAPRSAPGSQNQCQAKVPGLANQASSTCSDTNLLRAFCFILCNAIRGGSKFFWIYGGKRKEKKKEKNEYSTLEADQIPMILYSGYTRCGIDTM